MSKLTAREVKELAKHFFSVARSLTDYREDHWDRLSKQEHQQLSRWQWSVYNSTDDLLALSAVMALDEAQETIDRIRKATQRANRTIRTTDDVKRVITIATQVVRLSGAVMSQSPLAIIAALADLGDATL